MNRRWYLDVNRLARSTGWAHGFMTDYYDRLVAPVGAGLLVLLVLLAAGWWRARREPRYMAAALWAALAALVALGVSEALVQVVAERRPYAVIRGAEVLVRRAPGYAFPSPRASLAGAVVAGLALARRWRLTGLAVLAALLLAFAGVYVGAEYPSDVAAGGALGVVVAVVLWPFGSWVLVPAVSSLGGGRGGRLVAARGSRDRPRSRPEPERAPRLPDARAMEALRAASEAARHANYPPPAASTPPVRTRTVAPGDQEAPNGKAPGS